MKMDMSAKPEDSEEPTNEGSYSQEQMEEMLESFVQAKKIEGDPQLLSMIKDYAMSKNKMIQELFDVNKVPPLKGKVKSVDEMKQRSKAMDMADMGSDE